MQLDDRPKAALLLSCLNAFMTTAWQVPAKRVGYRALSGYRGGRV